MERNKSDILILGGGPAGMAAALELSTAQKSFIVIEKETEIGGLAKTLKYGAYLTDIGPHRFFSKNPGWYELSAHLLGESWIKIRRSTTFYLNGKFLSYPIDIKNILLNADINDIYKIASGYLYQRIKNRIKKKTVRTFQDYAILNFGEPLARLNMLNYTQKIWGMPCSQISSDWAEQRIKGLSFNELCRAFFPINGSHRPKTLINDFYYPDEGMGMLFERINNRIVANNRGCVKLNSRPTKIKHRENRITQIDIITESGIESLTPEHLISSIPINEFVSLLEPNAPAAVLEAAGNLKFRAHVCFFITLNKQRVFPYQWVYFPQASMPFGRIMEPKNWSKKMAPDNKTSLLVEFFCWENDALWSATKEGLLALTLPWLEKCGFLKENEIIDCFVHRQKNAYPVYELNYKSYLDLVTNYLNNFTNLQCIGRSGIFRYGNIDHALEMGSLAAKNILNSKRYNTEAVGTERTYFEHGL